MTCAKALMLSPLLSSLIALAGVGSDVRREKTVKISLQSIYSTSRQESLKHADSSFRLKKDGSREYSATYGALLNKVLNEYKGRSTNLILTRGPDIDSAIAATYDVLFKSRSTEEPATSIKYSDSQQIWLMAYLGMGGGGDQFIITAAERDDRTIRLSYLDKGHGIIPVVVSHYYWVPLGRLERATYLLELVDSKSKEVMLQRRVKIP